MALMPITAKHYALLSIWSLKVWLRASRIDPAPPVWEIWTRCQSVVCVASRYLSYKGWRVEIHSY